MIAIINYDAGNLASVSNALKRLDEPHLITRERHQLDKADGILFPGVGHADPAMQSLRKNRLDQWLRETRKPVLGICLGMQLLFESSEEGDTECLGLIPGRLKKFQSETHKVPHMGWNTSKEVGKHPLVTNLGDQPYFYYVHSYFAPVSEHTIATCSYIHDFASVVGRKNYLGVQFHPEKSGVAGSRLLQNFLGFVKSRT